MTQELVINHQHYQTREQAPLSIFTIRRFFIIISEGIRPWVILAQKRLRKPIINEIDVSTKVDPVQSSDRAAF
jgi:hypothetical protein